MMKKSHIDALMTLLPYMTQDTLRDALAAFRDRDVGVFGWLTTGARVRLVRVPGGVELVLGTVTNGTDIPGEWAGTVEGGAL